MSKEATGGGLSAADVSVIFGADFSGLQEGQATFKAHLAKFSGQQNPIEIPILPQKNWQSGFTEKLRGDMEAKLKEEAKRGGKGLASLPVAIAPVELDSSSLRDNWNKQVARIKSELKSKKNPGGTLALPVNFDISAENISQQVNQAFEKNKDVKQVPKLKVPVSITQESVRTAWKKARGESDFVLDVTPKVRMNTAIRQQFRAQLKDLLSNELAPYFTSGDFKGKNKSGGGEPPPGGSSGNGGGGVGLAPTPQEPDTPPPPGAVQAPPKPKAKPKSQTPLPVQVPVQTPASAPAPVAPQAPVVPSTLPGLDPVLAQNLANATKLAGQTKSKTDKGTGNVLAALPPVNVAAGAAEAAAWERVQGIQKVFAKLKQDTSVPSSAKIALGQYLKSAKSPAFDPDLSKLNGLLNQHESLGQRLGALSTNPRPENKPTLEAAPPVVPPVAPSSSPVVPAAKSKSDLDRLNNKVGKIASQEAMDAELAKYYGGSIGGISELEMRRRALPGETGLGRQLARERRTQPGTPQSGPPMAGSAALTPAEHGLIETARREAVNATVTALKGAAKEARAATLPTGAKATVASLEAVRKTQSKDAFVNPQTGQSGFVGSLLQGKSWETDHSLGAFEGKYNPATKGIGLDPRTVSEVQKLGVVTREQALALNTVLHEGDHARRRYNQTPLANFLEEGYTTARANRKTLDLIGQRGQVVHGPQGAMSEGEVSAMLAQSHSYGPNVAASNQLEAVLGRKKYEQAMRAVDREAALSRALQQQGAPSLHELAQGWQISARPKPDSPVLSGTGDLFMNRPGAPAPGAPGAAPKAPWSPSAQNQPGFIGPRQLDPIWNEAEGKRQLAAWGEEAKSLNDQSAMLGRLTGLQDTHDKAKEKYRDTRSRSLQLQEELDKARAKAKNYQGSNSHQSRLNNLAAGLQADYDQSKKEVGLARGQLALAQSELRDYNQQIKTSRVMAGARLAEIDKASAGLTGSIGSRVQFQQERLGNWRARSGEGYQTPLRSYAQSPMLDPFFDPQHHLFDPTGAAVGRTTSQPSAATFGILRAQQAQAQLGAHIASAFSSPLKPLQQFWGNLGQNLTKRVQEQAQLAQRRYMSGATLSFGFTMPVLGAAAVGVREAGQMDSTLHHIAALTDVSEKELPVLEDKFFNMSKALPQSAGELAKSYYFIASNDYKGKDAANILDVASKGSAGGLGYTESISDVLTSALVAYESPSSMAKTYSDQLTAGVKMGKGEAYEFAPAIGRTLGEARTMGIGFDEVVANIATMSRVGIKPGEGANSLNMLLQNLGDPSLKAEKTLNMIGSSGDQVRKSLRENGLLATLKDLMDLSGGNIEIISRLVGSVRGLRNVLVTAGAQSTSYAKILKGVQNSDGATDEAFDVMSHSAQFKGSVALNKLKAAAIEPITQILPGLADTASDASDALIKGGEGIGIAWKGVPDTIQKATFALGAFALAAGPLLQMRAGFGNAGQAALDLAGFGTQGRPSPLLKYGGAALAGYGVSKVAGYLGAEDPNRYGWMAGAALVAPMLGRDALALGSHAATGLSGLRAYGTRVGAEWNYSRGLIGRVLSTEQVKAGGFRFQGAAIPNASPAQYTARSVGSGLLSLANAPIGGAGGAGSKMLFSRQILGQSVGLTAGGALGIAGAAAATLAIGAAAIAYQNYKANAEDAANANHNFEVSLGNITKSLNQVQTLMAPKWELFGGDALKGFRDLRPEVQQIQDDMAQALSKNDSAGALKALGNSKNLIAELKAGGAQKFGLSEVEFASILESLGKIPDQVDNVRDAIKEVDEAAAKASDPFGQWVTTLAEAYPAAAKLVDKLAELNDNPALSASALLGDNKNPTFSATGAIGAVADWITGYAPPAPAQAPQPAKPQKPEFASSDSDPMGDPGAGPRSLYKQFQKSTPTRQQLYGLNEANLQNWLTDLQAVDPKKATGFDVDNLAKVKERLGKLRAENPNNGEPTDADPRGYDEAQQRAQAERTQRLRKQANDWGAIGAAVESAGGKIAGYAGKTEEARMRQELLKHSVQGLTSAYIQQALELGRVSDAMERVANQRDGLRGTFDAMNDEFLKRGYTSNPFAKQIAGAEKSYGTQGVLQQLSDRGNTLQTGLSGYAQNQQDTLQDRLNDNSFAASVGYNQSRAVQVQDKVKGHEYGGVYNYVARSGDAAKDRFSPSSISGVGERGNMSDHPDGRALDFMVPKSGKKGAEMAEYFRANAAAQNATYVIWNDKIWSKGKNNGGWKDYVNPQLKDKKLTKAQLQDPKYDTLQHRDHVHVSYETPDKVTQVPASRVSLPNKKAGGTDSKTGQSGFSGQQAAGQIANDVSGIGDKIADAALLMQAKRGNFKHQCDRLADTTVNSVTGLYKDIMGPFGTDDSAAKTMARFQKAGIGAKPDGTYRAGDIGYTGTSAGQGAGHVQIRGKDGQWYDQYGAHAKATTPIEWVVRPGGGQLSGQSGFSPSDPVLEKLVKIQAVPIEADQLNRLAGVPKWLKNAWGKGVKDGDNTKFRSMFQSQLFSREGLKNIAAYQAQVGEKKAAQAVKGYRQIFNRADSWFKNDDQMAAWAKGGSERAQGRFLKLHEDNPYAALEWAQDSRNKDRITNPQILRAMRRDIGLNLSVDRAVEQKGYDKEQNKSNSVLSAREWYLRKSGHSGFDANEAEIVSWRAGRRKELEDQNRYRPGRTGFVNGRLAAEEAQKRREAAAARTQSNLQASEAEEMAIGLNRQLFDEKQGGVSTEELERKRAYREAYNAKILADKKDVKGAQAAGNRARRSASLGIEDRKFDERQSFNRSNTQDMKLAGREYELLLSGLDPRGRDFQEKLQQAQFEREAQSQYADNTEGYQNNRSQYVTAKMQSFQGAQSNLALRAYKTEIQDFDRAMATLGDTTGVVGRAFDRSNAELAGWMTSTEKAQLTAKDLSSYFKGRELEIGNATRRSRIKGAGNLLSDELAPTISKLKEQGVDTSGLERLPGLEAGREAAESGQSSIDSATSNLRGAQMELELGRAKTEVQKEQIRLAYLLNDLKDKNIRLSEQDVKALSEIAQKQGEVAEQVKKNQDYQNDAEQMKSVFGGAFDAIAEGGKNMWRSLGQVFRSTAMGIGKEGLTYWLTKRVMPDYDQNEEKKPHNWLDGALGARKKTGLSGFSHGSQAEHQSKKPKGWGFGGHDGNDLDKTWGFSSKLATFGNLEGFASGDYNPGFTPGIADGLGLGAGLGGGLGTGLAGLASSNLTRGNAAMSAVGGMARQAANTVFLSAAQVKAVGPLTVNAPLVNMNGGGQGNVLASALSGLGAQPGSPSAGGSIAKHVTSGLHHAAHG